MERGQSPTAPLQALARATGFVAEGLPEEQLMPLIASCAAEALDADVTTIYLLPEAATSRPAWRMAGCHGGNHETLDALPMRFGEGGGALAPLFQSARELSLEGVELGDGLPRAIAAVPVRRRDGRLIGALLVGSSNALSSDGVHVVRTFAQLIGIGFDNARLAAGQQRERRVAAQSAVTLGTVLESVGTGVCVVELDGTVRVVNKALQDLFGLPPRTAGVSQAEVFRGARNQTREQEAFLGRLQELNAEPAETDHSEWELATEPPRVVQRYSAPMRSLTGEVVGRVEVYTDITESRRLYTQLLNSERLRVIGEMASGVAHDFNNLLASIVGQTELLHPDELPPATGHAISTIRQAALDGARMVRNLQGLARPRLETPSTTADLHETVQLAVEMARPRYASASLHGGKPLEIVTHLGDAARVSIDPAELREVLLNLLFNAADAMPEGGRVSISTRPGRMRNTTDLEVRDTGQGMPESVRARIFEPFFSTKGPKGSGLGLAVAYSILTRRGATIEVDSELGVGTAFTLSLPRVPSSTAQPGSVRPRTADGSSSSSARRSEAARPADASSPAGLTSSTRASEAMRSAASAEALRGARILVADDEPGLVAIVRQLMERSGAIVAIADGGRAALEVLANPQSTFDVVITDLDMPEVDGWAVAATVKRDRPGTHVVMLTGWAGEIAPEDFKARGVDVVLSKPCSRADLEAAIGTLLTPKPARGFDVLLVDDEPAFAGAVRGLLALQGHQVTVVESAKEALEAVTAHAFDVVLTDYSLGDVTGAELAEQLDARGARPYVVLVTGYATEIDDPSLLTRGVNAVLPKPCRGDDLREVLSRVGAR